MVDSVDDVVVCFVSVVSAGDIAVVIVFGLVDVDVTAVVVCLVVGGIIKSLSGSRNGIGSCSYSVNVVVIESPFISIG